jgi:sodium transport system permease protein
MKKECTRIFSDRKLFFTAVLLPGLLIYIMYTMMGTLMGGLFAVDDEYVYEVYAVNMPSSVISHMKQHNIEIVIKNISEADAEEAKQLITDRKADLLLVFPQDFDELVAAYDVTVATAPAPNVQVWSNIARPASMSVQQVINWVLKDYHSTLAHKFSINAATEEVPDGNYELATEADMFATVMGFMIPLLFVLFIYTGCLAIAPESIAGEKERGTLGTMLVTPARRRDMAIGKILSIAFFGLLSAVGSMVGMVLSMPRLMQLESGAMDFYGMKEYALLFVVAATTTLVFVSALSLMSSYAKSVKEANAYAQPFMIVCMLCGLSSMLTGGVPSEIYYYLIPVFNSAQCFTAILNFEVSAVNIAVTAAANIAFTLICAGVIARIFNSEKIVFDK